MKPSPAEIQSQLAELDPAIEFLAMETFGGDGLRIVVDHPNGVTLALCERVTTGLEELLAEHALEVTSPGPERPLAKPAHFKQFDGHRAKIVTREPIEGRRNFTGRLFDPGAEVTGIECDGIRFRIPHADIKRAHLVPEIPEGASK